VAHPRRAVLTAHQGFNTNSRSKTCVLGAIRSDSDARFPAHSNSPHETMRFNSFAGATFSTVASGVIILSHDCMSCSRLLKSFSRIVECTTTLAFLQSAEWQAKRRLSYAQRPLLFHIVESIRRSSSACPLRGAPPTANDLARSVIAKPLTRCGNRSVQRIISGRVVQRRNDNLAPGSQVGALALSRGANVLPSGTVRFLYLHQ
jgi:hypothetical protein